MGSHSEERILPPSRDGSHIFPGCLLLHSSLCQCFHCAYVNLQGPRLTLEELSELAITPDEDLLERLRKRAAGEEPEN
jgi:hypothetical protein